jgi:hypothetical protein
VGEEQNGRDIEKVEETKKKVQGKAFSNTIGLPTAEPMTVCVCFMRYHNQVKECDLQE